MGQVFETREYNMTANIIKKCNIFNHKLSDLKTFFVIVISGILVAFAPSFIPMEQNDAIAIISPYDSGVEMMLKLGDHPYLNGHGANFHTGQFMQL